jgi:hypothetical protein
MFRTLAVAAILALLAFAPAIAGQPSATHHGGLVCFSIMSPGAAKQLPTDRQTEAQRGWIAQSSCDDMCAARRAACVTTGGFSKIDGCADVPPHEASIASCRCCGR